MAGAALAEFVPGLLGCKENKLDRQTCCGETDEQCTHECCLENKKKHLTACFGSVFFYKFICFCACVYGGCGVHVWKPEDSLGCWSLPLACLRQGILLTAELCTPGLLVGELLEGQLSTPHFTEGGLGPHTLLRVSADPSSGCRAYRARLLPREPPPSFGLFFLKMWVY